MNRYSHVTETHADTGLELVRLTCEADASRTEIAFAPAMGCNIMSFVVDGREYLVASGDGRVLGTPILYPMPNRVRNAHFEFDGHSFDFEPNNTGNFIHGLVRERPWAVDEPVITNEGIACTMRFVFAPGCEAYDLFPISNTLTLKLTLSPHKLRFDWTIENQDESRRLPFGLAIHPYFAIQGERARVRLQVPAQKAMEAVDLLPTGKLIDIEDTPLGEEPVRLSELDLDDVFLGMAEDRPQVIYYDALGKKITLTASDFFTHTVVFTPQGKPFFCIENQSCSTDAHNFYARGLQDVAHLTILDPGQQQREWIEFQLTDF